MVAQSIAMMQVQGASSSLSGASRASIAGPSPISLRQRGAISASRRCVSMVVSANADVALMSGSCCLPHPDKVAKGGEDAHFILQTGYGAMGVADGVGGWAEYGVDPADYSKGFMATASETVAAGQMDMVEVLRTAHTATDKPGAATAVVMAMNPETKILEAANLGDSGFRIIRQGTIIFASPSQMHMFDCPFQFGHPNYAEVTDYADSADMFELAVEVGDVVVMGSDGLWDNVYDKEIQDIVLKCNAPKASATREEAQECAAAAAQALAKVAQEHSMDEEFVSPYVVEAEKQGQSNVSLFDKMRGKTMTGGKLDDITVCVGYVTEKPYEPEPEPEPEEEEEEVASEGGAAPATEAAAPPKEVAAPAEEAA